MIAITVTLEPINYCDEKDTLLCINARIGVSLCTNFLFHYKKLSNFQNILDAAFHA